MKFSTREDIEAPIEFVYARVTDFAAYERQALRRGGDIRRLDDAPEPTVGSAWDVAFSFRGKDRRLRATLVRLDAPTDIQLDTQSSTIDASTTVELVQLSKARTRVSVSIEITPKSLAARLLVQSLKLAKSNLSRKFKNRVEDFAEDTEARYRQEA